MLVIIIRKKAILSTQKLKWPSYELISSILVSFKNCGLIFYIPCIHIVILLNLIRSTLSGTELLKGPDILVLGPVTELGISTKICKKEMALI